MSETASRYYDRNAETIVDVLGHYYNSALVSRSDELATCLEDDLRYIVETAGIEDGHAVFEGGSGNGLFCQRLLQRLPKLRYTGVELSTGQIGIARRNNPGVEFRQGRFEAAQFAPASLDRALFLETLGYCTDIDALAQRLHDALRPGGKVFVKNPGQDIVDYADSLAHARFFDPVRREYGFDDRSLGIVPDIAFIVKKFEMHGFRLRLEAYPYFNEFFYNAAFYAPEFSRPVHLPEKTTIAFDWPRFDPERSLTALGRNHPAYVEYHRRNALGLGHRPRNRLTGCVVLVFERPLEARA